MVESHEPSVHVQDAQTLTSPDDGTVPVSSSALPDLAR